MPKTAPIEQEHRAMMNALAGFLDHHFNGENGDREPKLIFALVLAESGRMENGRVNYISNGARDDMVSMLHELLGRWEGRTIEKEPETAQ